MNERSFTGTVWPCFVPVEERAVVHGNGWGLFRAHRGTSGRSRERLCRISCPSRNEWSFTGTVWPCFVPVDERAVVHGNGLALFRARRGTRGRSRERLGPFSFPWRNEWSSTGTFVPYFVPERSTCLHQEGAGRRQRPRKTLKKEIPADCFHFRRIFVIFVC